MVWLRLSLAEAEAETENPHLCEALNGFQVMHS